MFLYQKHSKSPKRLLHENILIPQEALVFNRHGGNLEKKELLKFDDFFDFRSSYWVTTEFLLSDFWNFRVEKIQKYYSSKDQ